MPLPGVVARLARAADGGGGLRSRGCWVAHGQCSDGLTHRSSAPPLCSGSQATEENEPTSPCPESWKARSSSHGRRSRGIKWKWWHGLVSRSSGHRSHHRQGFDGGHATDVAAVACNLACLLPGWCCTVGCNIARWWLLERLGPSDSAGFAICIVNGDAWWQPCLPS